MKTKNLKPKDIIRATDQTFGWHLVPREWIGKKAKAVRAKFLVRAVGEGR